MTASDAAQAAGYDLPLPTGEAPAARAAGGTLSPESLLVRNIFWFCHLRWMVVAILGGLGILGLFPQALAYAGLQLPVDWPLAAAGVLAAGNLGFHVHARLLRKSLSSFQAHLNLWGQIGFDLVILTAVVHFVGSLGTSMPFAYLFHIVLACIFFSRFESLLITLMACVLYMACVLAEQGGLLPTTGMYAAALVRGHIELTPGVFLLNVALALGIWLTVWYLASRLAAMVQARDVRLAEANRRLEAAIEDRSRHMLRTTHELKAPFAAIDATTQLLMSGECGPLPDGAAEAVRRISARCRRLANEIQEMVQLANLRSHGQGPLRTESLDVAEILRWCIAQVQPLAEEQKVVVEARLDSARTKGVDDHLKMLLGNILGNAVVYSHEGGCVCVTCAPAASGNAVVTIADQGIGIPESKLPYVFDEYYRTNEAVRHNKQSSGLGLAIVRHVAEAHGIRIHVTSRPGAGTTFRLEFPAGETDPSSRVPEKESEHGVPDGYR